MSFSIKCNKCGAIVEELKDFTPTYSDNETLSDSNTTIKVSSRAGYHSTSQIEIECECGNEL